MEVKRSESFQEEGTKKSRPGTGRILPVPPRQSPPRKSESPRGRVRLIKSPGEEEGKTRLTQEDEDKDEMWRRDPRSADPSIDVDYFFQNHKGRVPAGAARTGYSSHYDTHRSESPDSPLTGRSSATLATNVLLGDTSEVVQAVRSRRSLRETSQNYSARSNGQSTHSEAFIPIKDDHSDSENGSFFAIVDGHGHWRDNSRPGYNKSASVDCRESHDSDRPGYSKSRSVDAREVYNSKPPSTSVVRARGQLSVVTKPLSSKPKEKTYIVSKPNRQSSSSIDLDGSLASEHSESESILSTSTDYSYTETSSPKMSRKGSGGKGPMSMTRPNRAFQLRRAKADSDSEGGSTPRSTARPGSAGRPTSAGTSRASSTSGGLERNRPKSARDSARSDASLGAAIVKKSRENAQAATARRLESFNRTDNGRNSLRTLKQGNLSTVQSRRSPDPRELRSKSATPKSMAGGSLAVTGINESQPNSRSNSPRSQEYSAWKRRKGYDPRQAVANAKAAKTKSNKASRMERAKSVGACASHEDDVISDRWRRNGRHDTMSSMSSDGDFGDKDGSDLESERTDEITRISAELRSKVDAMAKNINTDRGIGAADRSLVGV